MKSFKTFVEEPTMTTGPGIAGTSPNDPADWSRKKKRKAITRRYIEVNGKFKRQTR